MKRKLFHAPVAVSAASGTPRAWWRVTSAFLLLATCLMLLHATAVQASLLTAEDELADEARQLQLMLLLHQNGSVPMMPRLPQTLAAPEVLRLESSPAHLAYAWMADAVVRERGSDAAHNRN